MASKKIIAVTGCPTGIAHTFLAAKSLITAAEVAGYEMKVETHGAAGAENVLSESDIQEAVGIIVACDKPVDLTRFHGKKMIKVPVKMGIRAPQDLITKVLDDSTPIFQTDTIHKQEIQSSSTVYQALMNGVSYMIPFVITGGLLIAIALALGGESTPKGLVIPEGNLWNQVLNIGVVAFTLMIPVLSGYIAYAIGERAAFPAGLIGGWIANNGSFYGASAGTGFLGAIVAGFAVGYFVKWMKSWKYPSLIEPIVPLMIIPICSTLFIGALFIYIIGAPIAGMMLALTNMLVSLSTGNLIVLGIIMGLMQGFDMGGPVGKVVLLFNIGLLAEGRIEFMGAQAVAIPVAPLGMSLAVLIGKKWNLFTEMEINNAKASFAMGLVGISEGAIPFAVKDPLTVIPSNMIGSAVACCLAFILGIGCNVAHGGPIIILLGGFTKPLLALFCMIGGSVVTALVAVGLKLSRRNSKEKSIVQ